MAKMAEDAYNTVRQDSDTKIISNKKLNAHGFVKYKDGNIVVSLRGMEKYSINTIKVINAIKKSYIGCKECKVHTGFYQSYSSVKNQILLAVKTNRTETSRGKCICNRSFDGRCDGQLCGH